jgi:outer membrane protein assembly factor BamA
VRGYQVNSFDPSECLVTQAAACNVFDQLVGSRMAVGSAEFRFPLVGLFTRKSLYGPLPIEIALFGDAGKAWTSSDGESLFGNGDRDWVRSAGAALRLNAFGYAIVELDYVRPFDRPGRGWMWQFNLTPGF